MAPWFALLEAWAVQQLLRTPGFHRVVEKIARRVHRARHGLPPDQPTGTEMENPNGFMKHFMEEIKAQMGNAEQQQQKAMMDSARRTPPQPESTSKTLEDQHSAEAVWRLAQRNSVKHEAAQKRSGPKQSAPTQEDADAIWREAIRNGSPQAPKGSFMGEYMSALREQMRQNPKGK